MTQPEKMRLQPITSLTFDHVLGTVAVAAPGPLTRKEAADLALSLMGFARTCDHERVSPSHEVGAWCMTCHLFVPARRPSYLNDTRQPKEKWHMMPDGAWLRAAEAVLPDATP